MSPSHAANPRTTSRSRTKLIFLWPGVILLLVILASVAWVGVRAVLAKSELESAVPLALKIQTQVTSGDTHAAAQTFEQLDSHASSAAALTSDPVWRAFEILPEVGPNLAAVRQLATIVDEISQNAVRPLTEVAGAIELTDFKPVDGTIDVKPLVEAQPRLAAADAALAQAKQQVRAIDTSKAISAVQNAVASLESAVDKAAGSVNTVNRAVRLLPAMLGATGPRDYLLLFQNPAELRATGGIPGAVALVHTDHGRIDLAEQASSSDFPHYETSVLDLADETVSLYGDITGKYIQDVNLTPHFATSAVLAREMWRLQFGVEPDGVLSIDPVALSYLLKATGPIALPTRDVLSSDNAVQLLLSDAYSRYSDPADQDAFFAAAAASVFSAVSSGKADPVKLIEALVKAGSEHRVLVWSAHKDDQAVLADTTLAGGLPVSDGETKRFGVYLNDATGSKMDLYLEVKLGLGQVTCRQDGRPNYTVGVTLTNTAPKDAATALPEYVTGGGVFGVQPGNIKTVVSVYGAPGMENLGMTRDGKAVPYHPATDSTYPVSLLDVELKPGKTAVLQSNWLGAKPFTGKLVAQSTPFIKLNPVETIRPSCG